MLTPEQIQRLTQRHANLTIHPSCTVADCLLADGVTLDPGAEVRWSIIGGGAHIGANAVVRDARIEAHARIPADTTLIQPEDAGLREEILESLPLHLVHKHWLAARGDETLRLNYDLRAGEVVLDVGGYLGDWAQDMLDRHPVHIYVFEPVRWFQEKIRQRLHTWMDQGQVRLFPVGLAGRTRKEEITLAQESSSVVNQNVRTANAAVETISLIAAEELFRTFPPEIALMKINIEGAEYELLEHLLAEKLIPRIRHLQIQFHNFVDDACNRRRGIREALAATHSCQYNYPFIWESWTRKQHP